MEAKKARTASPAAAATAPAAAARPAAAAAAHRPKPVTSQVKWIEGHGSRCTRKAGTGPTGWQCSFTAVDVSWQGLTRIPFIARLDCMLWALAPEPEG